MGRCKSHVLVTNIGKLGIFATTFMLLKENAESQLTWFFIEIKELLLLYGVHLAIAYREKKVSRCEGFLGQFMAEFSFTAFFYKGFRDKDEARLVAGFTVLAICCAVAVILAISSDDLGTMTEKSFLILIIVLLVLKFNFGGAPSFDIFFGGASAVGYTMFFAAKLQELGRDDSAEESDYSFVTAYLQDKVYWIIVFGVFLVYLGSKA